MGIDVPILFECRECAQRILLCVGVVEDSGRFLVEMPSILGIIFQTVNDKIFKRHFLESQFLETSHLAKKSQQASWTAGESEERVREGGLGKGEGEEHLCDN